MLQALGCIIPAFAGMTRRWVFSQERQIPVFAGMTKYWVFLQE
jgi:hypothetical protein